MDLLVCHSVVYGDNAKKKNSVERSAIFTQLS